MAESFLQLPADEKQKALDQTQLESGCEPRFLEKDVWVVWAIRELFATPFGKHLVFKGGTSLSKGYGAIQRFSEDVDLTYDIRKLIPDMIGDAEDALPPSRNQQRRWSSEVRKRLPGWIADSVMPILKEALQRDDLFSAVNLRTEEEKVFIKYEPSVTGYGYIAPEVILEFGARSTGEPYEQRRIDCDAAKYLEEFDFPEATPRIMQIGRTFWEKATAVHVYCLRERGRGERFSRHFYDLACLDDAGYVDAALQDRDLAMKVAQHKGMFFVEKDTKRQRIDYKAAVCGKLVLVPEGKALEALAEDYNKMIKAGFLENDPASFESVMERCRDIEKRANGD